MSHGDYMAKVPEGFTFAPTRRLPDGRHLRRDAQNLRRAVPPGGQSHRTGLLILRNFLYRVCKAAGDWTMADYRQNAIRSIREKVGSGKALLALSGGVDSPLPPR